MNASASASRIWLSAVVGGAAVTVIIFSLFSAPLPVSSTKDGDTPSSAATVELAWQGNTLLIEEVALRDPTPLFLPTHWNASEDALAMNAPREPGGAFQDYAPHFTFPETELQIEFRAPAKIPATPADALATTYTDAPLLGLGRVDHAAPTLQSRDGFVEIVSATDGAVMMREPLKNIGLSQQGTWQPLEFMVAIDAAGVVRPPVLTESSRVSQVDSFFEEYLVRVFHIGERLAPGFYRISIGP